MDKCKPVPTPQVKGNLHRPGAPEVEPYLAQCPRPDIANAVRTLGKYLNCLTHEHHVLAKRVLRYLRGTTDYGLVWTRTDKPDLQVVAFVDSWRFTEKEVQVVAHADADLGNEKDDRRSVTGSEFVAASQCSTMIMWTHNICKELAIRRKKTVLYDDNQAAIAVIKADTGDYKVKGNDLKYHKVRDYFERGEFALEYCPAEENVADILTKSLGPTQFKKLRQLLNVLPVPAVGEETGANTS
ncbi:hypothetical protein ON010_g18065 [Phytophthora cinnamomi]|nr:hypothetical protein ON010_g18065 [Phytophthora cinnamomi]